MKEIAIIGSTASGKTALSLQIAHITNSVILSLDSLCVYKDIEIASAKPTLEARGDIIHFGIDEVYPNEEFDVIKFIELYKKVKVYCLANSKNLIIVGGTGFYLKALIEGLSQGVDSKIKLDIPLCEAYDLLYDLDKEYMQKIERNDRYRIEKAYAIYKQTGLCPTSYFEENPKIPVAKDLKIFEILWEKDELKKIDTFHRTFAILNILGVIEIFIGVFDEFGKGKEIKHKWKNVLKEITALHHFKVSIP